VKIVVLSVQLVPDQPMLVIFVKQQEMITHQLVIAQKDYSKMLIKNVKNVIILVLHVQALLIVV
jgi:hypothetical protein